MAVFDDQWFTGLQTAATSFMTAVAGFLGGWALMRRRISADSTAITEDKAGRDLLLTLMRERQEAVAEAKELRAADRTNAIQMVRLEVTVEDLRERLTERDQERERQVGACEERVRSLSEQLLDQKMANGRLFAELARADKDAADRMLVTQVRPGPPGKGDEPP